MPQLHIAMFLFSSVVAFSLLLPFLLPLKLRKFHWRKVDKKAFPREPNDYRLTVVLTIYYISSCKRAGHLLFLTFYPFEVIP